MDMVIRTGKHGRSHPKMIQHYEQSEEESATGNWKSLQLVDKI